MMNDEDFMEYVAIQTMKAIDRNSECDTWEHKEIAGYCYSRAAAMLEARAKWMAERSK